MNELIDFIENEVVGIPGLGIHICDTCRKPTKIIMVCKFCKDNFCLRCVSKHDHIEVSKE